MDIVILSLKRHSKLDMNSEVENPLNFSDPDTVALLLPDQDESESGENVSIVRANMKLTTLTEIDERDQEIFDKLADDMSVLFDDLGKLTL